MNAPHERYAGNVAAQQALLILTSLGLLPEMPDPRVPIGYRRNGEPIYPIAGGDDAGLEQRIAELTAQLQRMQPNSKADLQSAIREEMGRVRVPSGNAAAIAGGGMKASLTEGVDPYATPSALKAALGDDYKAGDFVTALVQARSNDAGEQHLGKAKLVAMGLRYADAPDVGGGKATLGTTGPTGGYVLPNNLVDTVEKPAIGAVNWPEHIIVRSGVMVRGVDLPYRVGAPTRMVPQTWGQNKENRDETYGSYTAPLVTFATIYDLAKQYLRFSAGAAEEDVVDELVKARRLAEEYSILAGPGTGTVGSGDATLGIVTSLLATPTWLGFRSAKTGSASSSTIAGSFASAIAEMCSLMATRARFPNLVVVDSLTYWTVLAQGSDTAGFWLNPRESGGFTIDANGGLSYFGVPIRHTPNFNSYTGTTKAALAIDGRAFKLHRGMEFRVDSSDQAGSRWDQNLVGFRGEAEWGFNAETGVHVGAAQLMTAVIP